MRTRAAVRRGRKNGDGVRVEPRRVHAGDSQPAAVQKRPAFPGQREETVDEGVHVSDGEEAEA